MTTEIPTPTPTDRDPGAASDSPGRGLISRVTRLEIIVAATVAAVMLVLVLVEPRILEAPFVNGRTLLFTIGGTALGAIALVLMLWLRVPAVARVTVLVVPFAIVNWWLLSPYFVDDVVDEGFAASIADQATSDADPASGSASPLTDAPLPAESGEVDPSPTPSEPATEAEPPPSGDPILLGAGSFIGLAGHSGSGDAGIFENPDETLVLRFENFDIENGPDLEVYLVPGPDQTSLAPGSIHLGALKGNVGDQNYDLPAGTELAPGAYTALVWCEAFTVEFVGATIVV